MSTVPARESVPVERTWDLEAIFETDGEWRAAVDAVAERVEAFADYEGRTTADASTLLTVLQRRDELLREVETVATYARMRRDEDTSDQGAQAMASRADSVLTDVRSAVSFVEPELQSLTREEFRELAAAEPALETYDHYVDDVLRTKAHTRSPEVEALLAELSEVTGATGDVYTMLANADMTFPTVDGPEQGAGRDPAAPAGGGRGEAVDGAATGGGSEASTGDGSGAAIDGASDGTVEITQSNFVTHLKRADRDFRRRVYEAYFEEWAAVRNAVATAYAKSVTADVELARARNYDTAREAALHGPNVPVEVYDTLVETVGDNLGPLHRHVALKREALGVDELRMWDVYVPLARGEGPAVPYEEACEHVIEAVAPLGEDYQSRLAEGLDSRWVDVYENRNKRAGAYSSGAYDTQPYILLNYQGDVASMYTLAHELGHSLHSEYATANQPYVYADYELFVAEVASTVNEALLTEHLLETVEDPVFRAHVLNEFVERVRSTLFRQTLFAEFEHRTHELVEAGEPLTADRLDERYRELKARYYEPAVLDDHIAREWMRIPHFYRAFYVYQYATGISAALALVDRILTEGESAAADYREFLGLGSREYPLDLLRTAGVDMTRPETVERAIGRYDRRLDELAAVVG